MRRRSIIVLDYGSGNLRSAQRALERAGAEVTVTADRAAAREADGLVVPGVGAFEACMTGLRAIGGDEIIAERVAAGRPVLGVCVGMQILFDRGVEFGVESRGCGLWPGSVTRLDAPVIPHMGWNTVVAAAGTRLFRGIAPDTRFYFVHSYAAQRWEGDPDALLTGQPTTPGSWPQWRMDRCRRRSFIRRRAAMPVRHCCRIGLRDSREQRRDTDLVAGGRCRRGPGRAARPGQGRQ